MPPSRSLERPIRVVICDDVAGLRALVRRTLDGESDLEVVGEAGDAVTGVELIGELEPDVVLLDLAMPGMDGLEAIPLMRDRSPASAIVVFSGFSEGRMRQLALERGAVDYVEKGQPLEHLPPVMRAAVAQSGR